MENLHIPKFLEAEVIMFFLSSVVLNILYVAVIKARCIQLNGSTSIFASKSVQPHSEQGSIQKSVGESILRGHPQKQLCKL